MRSRLPRPLLRLRLRPRATIPATRAFMEVPDAPHRWTTAGAAQLAQAKALRRPKTEEEKREEEERKKKGWSWHWKLIFGLTGGVGVPWFYLFMMGREPRLRGTAEDIGLGFHVEWLRRWFPSYFYGDDAVGMLIKRLDAAIQLQPVDVIVHLKDGDERRLLGADPSISEVALIESAGIRVDDVANVEYLDSELGPEAAAISESLRGLQESVGDARPLDSVRVAGRTFREPDPSAAPPGAHYFHDHPQFADARKKVHIGGPAVPYHNAPSLWMPPNGLRAAQPAQAVDDLSYPTGDEAVEMARQMRRLIRKAEAELRSGSTRDMDTIKEELRLLKSELWVLKRQNWSNARAWWQ